MGIDKIIEQFKKLYHLPGQIRFDTPEYVKFHNDLDNYIYQNHFENTQEWVNISGLLLFRSTQYLTRQAADTILTNLNVLKRRYLRRENTEIWNYMHPQIISVSKQLFLDGHYANAAEDAFIEINDRVKKLFKVVKPNETKVPDGDAAMTTVFSPKSPLLKISDTSTESGENEQKGLMFMLQGAMSAFRNPKAHANITITANDAVQRLMFASMLMYKIDEAVTYSKIVE